MASRRSTKSELRGNLLTMVLTSILGVAGEAKSMLEEAGAGIAIPPEDAPALAAAVRRLADDPTEAAVLGARGRDYVLAHFDRTLLARRMADAIAALRR